MCIRDRWNLCLPIGMVLNDIPEVHTEDDAADPRESAPEPEALEQEESSEPVAERQASGGPSPVGPERTGDHHCPSHTRAPKLLVPPMIGTNAIAQRRHPNQRGPGSDAARREKGTFGRTNSPPPERHSPSPLRSRSDDGGWGRPALHLPGKDSTQGRSTPGRRTASVASATSGSIHRY